MAGTYTYRTTVQVKIRFYDADAQPTDPPGVGLDVRRPDGTILHFLLTDPGTPIVQVTTGIYTAIIRASQPGRWGYGWFSTAIDGVGSQPAEEGYFDVKPSVFAPNFVAA